MKFYHFLIWLLGLSVDPAIANTTPHQDDDDAQSHTAKTTSVAIHLGQGLDTNLRMIPKQIVTGSLPWEKTWYVGVVVNQTLLVKNSFVFGLESALLEHRGLQSNLESTLAGTLRYHFPQVASILPSLLFGEGISYAYSRPTFEKGPNNSRQGQIKLQNHLAFEISLESVSIKGLALLGRIHHRSGVYGLFGPRHIGSNFIAAGLNYNIAL